MRTTIQMEPQLFKAVKKYAAEHGRTFTAVVEDAVREVLARANSERPAIELPISRQLGGAMPGVDLIKTSELLDPLEKYRGPA